MEELKANGQYFAYSKDLDLKAIFKKYQEDRYQEDLQGLESNFVRQYSRVGNLSMLQEEKLKAMLANTNEEAELISYVKYLVGEQYNAAFKFKREDFD